MKKLETKQILGLAALAVGALVVGKIVKDIKKIHEMTIEKEALLAEEEGEILALDPEEGGEPAIIDLDIEEPVENLFESASVEAEEAVEPEAPAAPAEEAAAADSPKDCPSSRLRYRAWEDCCQDLPTKRCCLRCCELRS